MEGHACLTSRDVGLPDKGGNGPTGLVGRRGRDFQEGAKEGKRWEAKVSSTTGMAV